MIIRTKTNSWKLPTVIMADPYERKYLYVVDGGLYSQKYCNKCKVYMNFRIKHCGRCDGCHLGYDHYCAWLNCCIHLTNYRFFLYFVFGSCLSFFIICASDIFTIITNNETKIMIMAIASLVQSSCGLLYTAYVSFFHIYLMINGITTK